MSDCVTAAHDVFEATWKNCTAFRTWCGAANAEEAAAHIFQDELPPPSNGRDYTVQELQGYRPCLVYWMSPQNGFKSRAVAYGAQWTFRDSVTFHAKLIQNATGKDFAAIFKAFKASVGAMIGDLEELAGRGGYLAISGIDILEGPYIHPENVWSTQGEAVWAVLALEAG